jgi:hypothetical protein
MKFNYVQGVYVKCVSFHCNIASELKGCCICQILEGLDVFDRVHHIKCVHIADASVLGLKASTM